jgi:predicted permease
LPHITWSPQLFFPALAPVIVWVGGWVYITLLSSKSRLGKKEIGGLKLSAGLSNTSFVGFPLIMAYFNEKAVGIAIICDQVTFALLATVGVVVAVIASQKHELSAGLILKRVLRFPPLLGCVSALIIPHFINISFLDPFFDKLATTVAPLALFSIGLQLQFDGWRSEVKWISSTLIYKLLLAPALVTAVAVVLRLKGIIPQIGIFEAAMPTLLTSGVVAEEYGLNPKLSNLIIGIGIILALASSALWYWLLVRVF